MIYTVTLNPALDMINYVDDLKGNYTNTKAAFKYPGGKAINVSRMLYNLNIPSYVTGFVGGYPGRFIKDWFNERNLETFFLEIEEDNRTTMRFKTNEKELTVAGVSPHIPHDTLEDLLFFLARVREGDIVVMGGSIPENVPQDIYKRISEICKANNAHFMIDIPAEQTLDALKDAPLLIKPNADNLALMFGRDKPYDNEKDLIRDGLTCVERGAQNVIVSIGAEGAYLFTKDKAVYRTYGVEGNVVNTFNARDAMIAAFIGTYMRKTDPVEAFKMASAAATATAFVEDLASKEEVLETFDKIKMVQLKEGEKEEMFRLKN